MLAGIGLYGLVAYVVGMSRQEIAIRMALGASAAGVTALIVRNGMALVVCPGRNVRVPFGRLKSTPPLVAVPPVTA